MRKKNNASKSNPKSKNTSSNDKKVIFNQQKSPTLIPQNNSVNQSNNSLLGNLVSGVTSGIGIGAGIEMSKSIGDKIFSNNSGTDSNDQQIIDEHTGLKFQNCKLLSGTDSNDQQIIDEHTGLKFQNCKLLSEMMLQCKKNSSDFTEYENLKKIFLEKCF